MVVYGILFGGIHPLQSMHTLAHLNSFLHVPQMFLFYLIFYQTLGIPLCIEHFWYVLFVVLRPFSQPQHLPETEEGASPQGSELRYTHALLNK